MKILQIDAYHYHRGGAQSVYFNLTNLLKEHGHEVVNFALKWPENEPSEWSEYFAESKESRTGLLKPFRDIGSYFYHTGAARNLRKLVRRERPDVAQVHLIWGQLTPSILRVLRSEGVPAILTNHDYRLICPAYLCRNGKGEVCEECEGRKFYKCVSNTCCKGSKALSMMMAAEQYVRNALFNPARLASGIIYVGDFSRNLHEKYMPSLKNLPSVRIYNFTPKLSDKIDEKEDYYLYLGRLSHEKGVRTLVMAAASLPDVNFKIAGTGPIEEELKAFVKEKNLVNVEFLGFKQGEELETLVAKAKFVVVPSVCYENNPLSLIEAYGIGTPVIGAEIGGIPEIIDEGLTGYHFKSGDVQSLANAIKESRTLSDSDYNAMCINCQAYANRNFSPESCYRKLIEFYETVIADK